MLTFVYVHVRLLCGTVPSTRHLAVVVYEFYKVVTKANAILQPDIVVVYYLL